MPAHAALTSVCPFWNDRSLYCVPEEPVHDHRRDGVQHAHHRDPEGRAAHLGCAPDVARQVPKPEDRERRRDRNRRKVGREHEIAAHQAVPGEPRRREVDQVGRRGCGDRKPRCERDLCRRPELEPRLAQPARERHLERAVQGEDDHQDFAVKQDECADRTRGESGRPEDGEQVTSADTEAPHERRQGEVRAREREERESAVIAAEERPGSPVRERRTSDRDGHGDPVPVAAAGPPAPQDDGRLVDGPVGRRGRDRGPGSRERAELVGRVGDHDDGLDERDARRSADQPEPVAPHPEGCCGHGQDDDEAHRGRGDGVLRHGRCNHGSGEAEHRQRLGRPPPRDRDGQPGDRERDRKPGGPGNEGVDLDRRVERDVEPGDGGAGRGERLELVAVPRVQQERGAQQGGRDRHAESDARSGPDPPALLREGVQEDDPEQRHGPRKPPQRTQRERLREGPARPGGLRLACGHRSRRGHTGRRGSGSGSRRCGEGRPAPGAIPCLGVKSVAALPAAHRGWARDSDGCLGHDRKLLGSRCRRCGRCEARDLGGGGGELARQGVEPPAQPLQHMSELVVHHCGTSRRRYAVWVDVMGPR